MMVVAFLAAVSVIRILSRNITPDPQLITNASLYALIAGVVGARAFYVVHYIDKFRDNPLEVFAIWNGGLELLGGVILAITVIVFYLRYHKLPARRYLDILAIGLMMALAFGRIGCYMRGCCFGKPAEVAWSVRFPYGSDPYYSQVFPNPDRNRSVPRLKLPAEYFTHSEEDGLWYSVLKAKEELSEFEKEMVSYGPYRCLPVHPTQLYSSVMGLFFCFLLYLFWKGGQYYEMTGKTNELFIKPGSTFALMFILYGVGRFFIEYLRDDNPFEYGWWAIYKGGTVSQNLGIYLVILGAVLMAVFQFIKSDKIKVTT